MMVPRVSCLETEAALAAVQHGGKHGGVHVSNLQQIFNKQLQQVKKPVEGHDENLLELFITVILLM